MDVKFRNTVVAHDMTKKERLECKASKKQRIKLNRGRVGGPYLQSQWSSRTHENNIGEKATLKSKIENKVPSEDHYSEKKTKD